MAGFVKLDAIEAIAIALARREVRYLVVGGLAMSAYGADRVTFDVDLVIQLELGNIERAFAAFDEAGYRPSVPVTAASFGDQAQRARWRVEKSMIVLNFWSDRFPETSLDVFIYEPFDFEGEYAGARSEWLLPDVPLRYPSVSALIEMKRAAGRPKDLQDVDFLERYAR